MFVSRVLTRETTNGPYIDRLPTARAERVEILNRTTIEGEKSAPKIYAEELSKFGARFDRDDTTNQHRGIRIRLN